MTYGGSRRPDLAARLRRGQRVLKSRLERPENVLALLRASHDSLDPESIGKLVVNRAEEWFKAPACGIFAADLDGQVVGLSSKGMGPALAPVAAGVDRWVISHGRELAAADLRKDTRAAGHAGAVIGWPLRCRAQTVAALVVLTFFPFHDLRPVRVVRLRWLTMSLIAIWALLALYVLEMDFRVGTGVTVALCATALWITFSDAMIRLARFFA